MAFPQTPLPLIVSIAPGADATATPDVWEAAGLWVNISNDVRVADGISITAGRSDEANQVDTTQCSMRLDNRAGNYSPRNPTGVYYGKLKKNTPIKVELQRVTDTFNRTVAAGWGTSDIGLVWAQADGSPTTPLSVSPAGGGVMGLQSANAVTANTPTNGGSWNTDVLMEFSLPVVPAGAAWITSAQLRRNGSVTFMGVSVAIQAGGQVDLTIDRFYQAGARFILSTQTSALATYTAARKVWIRARCLGVVTYAKCWYDGSAEPSGWTLTFTETNPDLMFDSEGSIGVLGANVGVHVWRVSGNTNTVQMNLWAFSSTAPVFMGQVIEWPVRWDKSANDSNVPLTASGVLRRLAQGQAPEGSPLFKTLSAEATNYGYWPLEDASGATTAFGRGANIKPATVYSASFGYSGKGLGGASSTMTITQDTTIAGVLPPVTLTPASGWTVVFYVLMEALPPSGQDATIMQIRTSGRQALFSIIALNSGALVYQTTDSDGVLGGYASLGVGSFAAATWYEIRMEVFQPANLAVRFTSINTTSGLVNQATFPAGTGNLGAPKSWAIYGSSTSFPAGSVGHVTFFKAGAVFTTTETLAAARGYAGETASARVIRLCKAAGIPLTTLGTSTTLMGAQTSDTLLDLLRQCETADLGVLYETNYAPGLGFRPRPARYSTASRLALNFASGHIAEAPEPTDDDQPLRNDWTVSRTGGSAAQVTDETSIAQQGRYDDSVEINVSTDDVLINHAGLRVFRGTLDALRWPKINLDLAKNPSLASAWLSFLVGSRFTVSNPPVQLPGQSLDVLVEGWTQTLSTYTWDIEINASPASAWSQFKSAADPASPASTDLRIDSASSFVTTGVSSSATSLSVSRAATDTAYWDTAAVPFDINVAGERMTVTAITGVGNPQTFTVTRAVNGVTKAQVTGAVVSLWLPGYVAL